MAASATASWRRSSGANVLDEEFPHRAGFYPVTVDASADPDGIACVLRSTDADGYSTSIGIYLEPTPLPLLDMFTQGITFVTGRPHVRTLMPDVLELVRQGKFDPDPMTVNRVDWDDAEEALSDLRAKTVVSRTRGCRVSGNPMSGQGRRRRRCCRWPLAPAPAAAR